VRARVALEQAEELRQMLEALEEVLGGQGNEKGRSIVRISNPYGGTRGEVQLSR
jgi:hypothetical protein